MKLLSKLAKSVDVPDLLDAALKSGAVVLGSALVIAAVIAIIKAPLIFTPLVVFVSLTCAFYLTGRAAKREKERIERINKERSEAAARWMVKR